MSALRFLGARAAVGAVCALGLGAPADAEELPTSPAILALQRLWKLEDLTLRKEAVKWCAVQRREGEGWGRFAARTDAPDCATLFLRAKDFAAALSNIRLFMPTPSLGFEHACYQSGWLFGFVMANDELWSQCEPQLDVALRIAIQRRADQCKQVADIVRADSESLWDFIKSLDVEPPDPSLPEMIALVSIGHSKEAWELLIRSQEQADLSSLPCQLVLGKTLPPGAGGAP